MVQKLIYNYNYSYSMTTTIQIKETTKQVLDRLKSKEKKESYDEVIKQLLEDKLGVDMFGFTKKKPLNFKKEDEMGFNEL